MSNRADLLIERPASPWLFASAAATAAPHLAHQPYWLSAMSLLLLLWAVRLWWKNERLPGRWLLILLVIAGCSGILIEFRTLFGRDAGVAMLVVFMTMKLLELKSRRDAMVIVVLAYFLLLTHYFYSQSIPTGIWLLVTFLLLTATLIRLHGGLSNTGGASLRYAARLCLQAIPFMLLLYLLFPRVSGPLWGLPSDAHSGMTGLSDTMSPGSISNLAQSADIAFRARFLDMRPARHKLYWRGPVLENFDGTTWRPHTAPGATPRLERISPPAHYELTLEAHNRRWILALDAPVNLPDGLTLNATLAALQRQPVTARQRFALAASLDYRFNAEEDPQTLARNLAIPVDVNPKARALARDWRQAGIPPEEMVRKAQDLFAAEFTYTLQPPRLGPNGIDEFLFVTRRGFCEHYAGAFVFLMRAAGIPARVVTGYQGGELNPLDNHLVIRQSDAHAWAEVWQEGRGWLRVDPTASVSPTRVEAGIVDALAFEETLPALVQLRSDWLRKLRHRWEAINNAWNQHILGYDPQRQRELLSRLGIPDVDWRSLAMLLGITCGTLLTAMLVWSVHRRPRIDPALRLWQKALRQLTRRQVHCAPWETPLALAARVRTQHPELGDSFQNVVDAYLNVRYGDTDKNLTPLREAIARLQR